MKLRSLHIRRLPGIAPGFALNELAPGVNVIVGPNASGKSSLVRALRAVLYREEATHGTVDLDAEFDTGDGSLHATRLGPQITWQRDGQTADAPTLPEHRFLSCFTLRIEDLLDQSNATDRDIAERLARELAGGYDLRAVREDAQFKLKATHGRDEAKALRAAQAELQQRQREQAELRRAEEQLSRLERERDEAREAARAVAHHEDALSLLAARHDVRSRETKLADFPPGMDRLRGDELDSLQSLQRKKATLAQELQRANEDHDEAARQLAASGLEETDLADPAIAEHRQALHRLRDVQTTLHQKRSALAAAEAKRDAAVGDLGGKPDRPVHLDMATIDAVEADLKRSRELRARISALRAELDRLPGDETPAPDLDAPAAARRELLAWLSAPAETPWTRMRILAAATAALAAAAAIVIAAAGTHWLLILLVLPFAWGAHRLLKDNPGEHERRTAQHRFQRLGLPEPKEWTQEGLRERLGELEDELNQGRQRQALLERRDQLRNALNNANEELDSVKASLDQLAERVGYDPSLRDGPLDRWLRLTLRYDEAHIEAEGLGKELQRLEAEEKALIEDAGRFLHTYDETPATASPDATALLARLDHLAERLGQRQRAADAVARAQREIGRLERDIKDTADAIAAVFEQAGVTAHDESELRRRLERLDDWRHTTEAIKDARVLERDRLKDLDQQPEILELVENDAEDALIKRRDEYRGLAANRESLIEEITRIRAEIERAGRERALEKARGEARAAEDALRDRLDEAFFAQAGTFLIEAVEQEHERASQPAALRRAAEWFAHFTHHEYQLEFSGDGETRFGALETQSGQRRQLSELSSGTRMQLLLAVRTAFALEAERGHESLPLILDEALTTADPSRFRAAVESLQALADEGRQVFYLTSQPADLAFWQAHDAQAHCVDLAQLRGREAAITAAEAIAVPEHQPPPAPQGQAPEQYAVEIGVPALDPWQPPEAIHLFYLLRDKLPLLHRLLEAGVTRAGQLQSLLDSTDMNVLLDEHEATTLRGRIEAARTWVRLWREGRARPIERGTLEEADAVTATFLDRVAALNDELGGDGRMLIERLAEGAVKGFRADKREALEAWLSDRGYIDERPQPSEAEMRLRLLEVFGQNGAHRDEAAREAKRIYESLSAGVQPRPEPSFAAESAAPTR